MKHYQVIPLNMAVNGRHMLNARDIKPADFFEGVNVDELVKQGWLKEVDMPSDARKITDQDIEENPELSARGLQAGDFYPAEHAPMMPAPAYQHEVDQQTLDMNPDLVTQGVKLGETIEIDENDIVASEDAKAPGKQTAADAKSEAKDVVLGRGNSNRMK